MRWAALVCVVAVGCGNIDAAEALFGAATGPGSTSTSSSSGGGDAGPDGEAWDGGPLDAGPDGAPTVVTACAEDGGGPNQGTTCPPGYDGLAVLTVESKCGGGACGAPGREWVCYPAGTLSARGGCDPVAACAGGMHLTAVIPTCGGQGIGCPMGGDYYVCISD